MARLGKPMISFIVPAYNEEHELSDTLAAIRDAASGAARPYEIVVVDDASTDATAKIASDAGAKVIPINRRQIAAARNAGHALRRASICSSSTLTRGSIERM